MRLRLCVVAVAVVAVVAVAVGIIVTAVIMSTGMTAATAMRWASASSFDRLFNRRM